MKLKTFIISMCICLFVVGVAWAVPFPADLNYSSIAGNTGITYATVYGNVINPTTFEFDIQVATGFLMRNFYFNTNLDLMATNFTIISPLSAGYAPTINYNSIQVDGFGDFDIGIEKTGQHNVTELIFQVTGLPAGWSPSSFYLLSTGSAGNGYGHFAAEIWDTVNDPTGARTFKVRDGGTPVPEPSTIILLGSGLLGLALYGKRKFRK